MEKHSFKSDASNTGIDWAAWIRTLALQVVILLALTGAAIAYVSWTSEVAVKEFMSQPLLSDPSQPMKLANRSRAPCDKRK